MHLNELPELGPHVHNIHRVWYFQNTLYLDLKRLFASFFKETALEYRLSATILLDKCDGILIIINSVS